MENSGDGIISPEEGAGDVRVDLATPASSSTNRSPSVSTAPTPNATVEPSGDGEISWETQRMLEALDRLPMSVKCTLPFIVILFLKFLADNLFVGSMLVIFIVILDLHKKKIKMQLDLKTHLSKSALWSLLASLLATLSLCYIVYPYMGYTENITQRLLIVYDPNIITTQSIWAVLWICCLTDIAAQTVAVLCKTLICLVAAHKNTYMLAIFSYISCILRSVGSYSSPQHHADAQVDDIEAQVSGGHTSNRQGAGRSHTISSHSHNSAQLTRRGVAADQPLLAPDDDTSDASDQLAHDIFRTRKLCNLCDIWFFVYRGFLPVPLWTSNLSSASLLGRHLFPVLYLAMKMAEMARKIRGAVEAWRFLWGQELEYGRYATISEYDPQTSSYDCPICFDSPKKAVALNCSHIFCEQCVCEWLEKEKTCPVCRQEVQSAAKALDSIKKDALAGNSYCLT
eukprot:gene33827-40928_t